MDSRKAIHISFIILMINSLIAMIYGLSAFLLPEVLVSKAFDFYTGQHWDDMLNINPEIANYILILEGSAGGNGMTAIIANLFVLLTAYRKGEKWAWFFVMIVSIVGWGNNLITHILMGDRLLTIIISSGLLLVITALIISARAFLAEKAS